MDSGQQKITTDPNVENKCSLNRNSGVLSPKWDIDITSPPCKDQGPSWKCTDEDCKNQRLGRTVVKGSSGHDRIKTLMQLWLPEEELHEI